MFNINRFNPVLSLNANRLTQTAVGISNLGDVTNTAVVLQGSSASFHG